MKNRSRYALPALLVAGALGLLLTLAEAQRTAARTANWTQALATIETVAVLDAAVELTYRYDAAEGAQAASRATLTVRNASSEAALRARYAPGRSVLIYVNPADATESVLEHAAPPSLAPLYGALFLLAAGIALALFARRPARSTPLAATGPAPVLAKPVRRPSRPMSRLRAPPSLKRT